jgi:hypothetical protein
VRAVPLRRAVRGGRHPWVSASWPWKSGCDFGKPNYADEHRCPGRKRLMSNPDLGDGHVRGGASGSGDLVKTVHWCPDPTVT